MPITKEELKAKKLDGLNAQVAYSDAQILSIKAQAAFAACSQEFAKLQAQKQIEDLEAQD